MRPLGASIVVLSKDSAENIEAISSEIIASGGHSLALNIDVSDFHAIEQAVAQAVDRFGGIASLVNNTSATCFTDTLHTSPQHFDVVVATSVSRRFFPIAAVSAPS